MFGRSHASPLPPLLSCTEVPGRSEAIVRAATPLPPVDYGGSLSGGRGGLVALSTSSSLSMLDMRCLRAPAADWLLPVPLARDAGSSHALSFSPSALAVNLVELGSGRSLAFPVQRSLGLSVATMYSSSPPRVVVHPE